MWGVLKMLIYTLH